MAELLLKLAGMGGPAGLIAVVLFLYIRHRDKEHQDALKEQEKELREVESKRVADAQSMVQKLLDLNDKWNDAINAQIEVQEGQKSLLSDLRRMLEDQIRFGRRGA